jgi:hypothetical protein
MCLRLVSRHYIYNQKLQTSLKIIQESLIVPTHFAEAGPDQTERTKGKVCLSSGGSLSKY